MYEPQTASGNFAEFRAAPHNELKRRIAGRLIVKKKKAFILGDHLEIRADKGAFENSFSCNTTITTTAKGLIQGFREREKKSALENCEMQCKVIKCVKRWKDFAGSLASENIRINQTDRVPRHFIPATFRRFTRT